MSRIPYLASAFLWAAAMTPGHAALRVAIAGLSHETNSFNQTKATLADFEGEDALTP